MAILHYHPHRPSSTGRRSLGTSASLVVSTVSGAGLLVVTVTDPRHLPLALATATVAGVLVWVARRQEARRPSPPDRPVVGLDPETIAAVRRIHARLSGQRQHRRDDAC